MGEYLHMTAAELAACLDLAAEAEPDTASLSMLDEATLAFGKRYGAVGPVQRALSEARHAHLSSYTQACGDYSPDAWDEAAQAARNLAAVLRPLGDAVIARCKRETAWGTCNLPLTGGMCHSRSHI
jgi:hypothetical protein